MSHPKMKKQPKEIPKCSKCGVEGKPCITTLARLYDPAMASDSPQATIPFWTGGYYCPKCKKLLGVRKT